MATKKVLIVDDSESMRQIVRRVLASMDVTVVEACRAKDGVQTLLQGSIDLLITDWNMIDIDGLEFTRVLRSLPSFEALPIVMLSNHNSEDARQEALQAGVDVFLSKCAPFDEWRQGVSRLLVG